MERKGLQVQSCGWESPAWRATWASSSSLPTPQTSCLSHTNLTLGRPGQTASVHNSLQPPSEPQAFGGQTCTAWPTASTWRSWPASVS